MNGPTKYQNSVMKTWRLVGKIYSLNIFVSSYKNLHPRTLQFFYKNLKIVNLERTIHNFSSCCVQSTSFLVQYARGIVYIQWKSLTIQHRFWMIFSCPRPIPSPLKKAKITGRPTFLIVCHDEEKFDSKRYERCLIFTSQLFMKVFSVLHLHISFTIHICGKLLAKIFGYWHGYIRPVLNKVYIYDCLLKPTTTIKCVTRYVLHRYPQPRNANIPNTKRKPSLCLWRHQLGISHFKLLSLLEFHQAIHF
jgi:hypothetical protein